MIPKSVTKVKTKNKNVEVTLEDSVDQANYYINELTRAALRDVGKLLKTEFRTRYYARFKRQTGDAGRVTKIKVYASKNTKYPRLEIGLKTGQADGFYAYFQEFGTSNGKVPKLGILQNSVKDNIAKIVEIESKYLSGLSGEAERLNAQIDEGEYDDNDN